MTDAVVLALLASLAAGAALAELVRLPARRRRPADDDAGRRSRKEDPAAQRPVARRWSATQPGDPATEALLDAAGRRSVPDAESLCRRRRLGALLGGAWGGAAGMLVLAPVPAVACAAAGAAGGRLLPGLLLRREGRARGARLQDETPELLDLLAAGFGCGLPPRGALEAAGRWSEGELSDGVTRAAAELARGAAIAPILDRLAREHPAPELEAAVAILRRSREHGTPAAAPLRALAVTSRHARARRAMEQAARAAPRVQLVAALLLVPAALCMLGASLLAGGIGG